MFSQARKFLERALVGDSVPALVRWGKHVPPSVVRKIQAESFVETVESIVLARQAGAAAPPAPEKSR